MVQRYSHLDPEHLHQAVERLVAQDAAELARNWPAAFDMMGGVG